MVFTPDPFFDPTVISSSLDGVTKMTDVNWNQTWTSPMSSNPFSSTFTGLDPVLSPNIDRTATVTKISGRGTPTIFQQSSAGNGYQLLVQFTDGFSGADFLHARITVVPEPTIAGMVIVGSIVILRRRR